MSDFHRTLMGQRFLEHTVPRLVEELARLNRNLERIVQLAEPPSSEPKGETSDANSDQQRRSGL